MLTTSLATFPDSEFNLAKMPTKHTGKFNLSRILQFETETHNKK